MKEVVSLCVDDWCCKAFVDLKPAILLGIPFSKFFF